MRYFGNLNLAIFLLIMCQFANAEDGSTSHNHLQKSERLIDAFYSFDKDRLEDALTFAKDSIPNVVFYQGWAKGGNYKIIKRQPCFKKKLTVIRCSITVQDDLMLALGIDFNVTDTFEIQFNASNIVSVDTSSNDLEVFWQAREWVKKTYPELIEVPCKGIWNGGPTPGKCVQAMVEGYARFSKSDDFPKQ
ncbi:hypothetical protein [Paraglaciecola sp.]|uniref:hypothetical protein n=1 Tax=Paraglaciecola sp. TaxID=1920173 RepID=UPI003EFA5794